MSAASAKATWDTLTAARRLAEKSENPRRWRLMNAAAAETTTRGNVAAAARTLEKAAISAESHSEFERLVYARLLLAQGQPRTAGGSSMVLKRRRSKRNGIAV